MDDTLDALQRDFIEAVFNAHDAENLDLEVAVQLALIARFYERIGDHAVNVAERVQYMVTGWLPEHTGAARVEQRRRRDEAAVDAVGSNDANGSTPASPDEA